MWRKNAEYIQLVSAVTQLEEESICFIVQSTEWIYHTRIRSPAEIRGDESVNLKWPVDY